MKISSVREGITWKDFLTEYRKFFRISFEPKLIEAMGKEYKRLTGRDPVDEIEKPKRSSHYKPRNKPSESKQNNSIDPD